VARSSNASPRGTNVARIDNLLDSQRRARPMDTHDEALGQLALTLAKTLDDGAGMAAAAVARELRATLADLMRERDDSDGDSWTADLSTPVRNPPES